MNQNVSFDAILSFALFRKIQSICLMELISIVSNQMHNLSIESSAMALTSQWQNVQYMLESDKVATWWIEHK